jgi:hypothetical protein
MGVLSSFTRRLLAKRLALDSGWFSVPLIVLATTFAGERDHVRQHAPPASDLARDIVPAATEAVAAEAATLMERWAPVFVQEQASDHGERDRPLRVDFDGDWDATNNWAHLTAAPSGQEPAVYASAILSEAHAFLTYTLFYPRDWIPYLCLPYVCHDNDLEVTLVVVERATGRLVLVETKTHNSYLATPANEVARTPLGRPVIEVESQGHGMRVRSSHGTWAASARVFAHGSTGLGDRDVETYALLPFHETLWARRAVAAADGRLWAEGETGFLWYDGARFGRRGFPLGASMASSEYPGGVRPAWALSASKQRGDWFLDPAHVALTRYPQWFSDGLSRQQRYVFNPYLADLTSECQGSTCARAPPVQASLARPIASGTLVLVAMGLALLRSRRRASTGSPDLGPRPLP